MGVTITVTKRILMAVTMVTRRIPTVKITMVINNPMEDTVKSNLMVNKATVMVMATNNTEAMDVNLTDTVTNLPMVTDTNPTVMDPNLNTVTTTTNNLTAILLTVIPTDTKAMEVTVTSNPMVDMVTSNLMVNTTATTTNLP